MDVSGVNTGRYQPPAKLEPIGRTEEQGSELPEKGTPVKANDPQDEKSKDKAISEKSVIDAIEKANKALEGTYTNLKFSIHEKTKQIMVKVINSQTQEVIREIPPEKVLDMVAKMWERAGLLVDERR